MPAMASMLALGSNWADFSTPILTSLATMDGIAPMQTRVTREEMFCELRRFLTELAKVALTMTPNSSV
jgi:hypothetical protein